VCNAPANLFKENRLTLMRLHQCHLTIGTSDRYWKSRKSRARADINDPKLAGRQMVGEEERLAVVAVPRIFGRQVQLTIPLLKKAPVCLQFRKHRSDSGIRRGRRWRLVLRRGSGQ